MAIETKAPEKNGTLIQRFTRMIFKNDPAAPVAAPAPAAPVESEEKRAERLEAYKKFCEEQNATEAAGSTAGQKKEFKYRAPDFNK
jgi:hypothetical protein